MFRKTVAVVVVLLVMAVPTFAQPEEIPAGSNVEDSRPQSYANLEGDVIFLKSGKVLQGITIARENPLYIEVEFLPGEAPLQLPRTAVDRIEYAKDKLSGRSQGGLGDVRLVPNIMPGEEVSPEFHRMLMAPMSEEELVLENVDYLVILRAHAAKFSAIIDVNEALDNLPPENRKFSRTIPAGKTFMNFLRTDLAEIAPQVRAILQYDKLVLQKREDVPAPGGDIPPPPMQ